MTEAFDPLSTLIDATEPVASEVTERDVEPALLMRDVHEAGHPEDDLLLVGHIGEVLNDRAVLLAAEPKLVEVLGEATQLASHGTRR